MAENSDQRDQTCAALLVVDVQPTFREGGALPVEVGNAVAARVADLHPALNPLADRIDARVRKGMHAAAYSGFEGADDDDRTLDDVLAAAGVTDIDVVGF